MIDLGLWATELPTAVAITAVLILPGSLLSLCMGVKYSRFPMTVPLLSMALIAVLPVFASPLGIPWGWGTLSIGTLAASAIVLGVRAAAGERQLIRKPVLAWGETHTPTMLIAGAVTFLISALLSAWAYIAVARTPSTPPQTWDAIFHLNAVEWIHRTGDGSTLHLAAASDALQRPGFYPAGWHDLVVLGYSGDAVAATTLTTIVVASVLWPWAAMVFASRIFTHNPWVYVAAPLLASSFTSFPERPASYGTLWPTLLSYALVPLLAAVLLTMLDEDTEDRWAMFTVALLGSAGVAISHPTAIFATLLIIVWALPQHLWGLYRGTVVASRTWTIFISATSALFVASMVGFSQTSTWKTVTSYPSRGPMGSGRYALWDALTDAQFSENGIGTPQHNIMLAIFIVVGFILVMLTRQRRFLAISWAVLLLFYLEAVTAWIPLQVLISPWYSDPVRIGAMLPLVAAPFAAGGLAFLVDRCAQWVSTRFSRLTHQQTAVVVLIVLLVAFDRTSWRFGLTLARDQLHKNYWQTDEDGLNSLILDDEISLMKRVGPRIPAGERVIGDPMNGSPLLYAIGHTDPYFKHVWPSGDFKAIRPLVGLSAPQIPQATCDFLRDHKISYLYTDENLYWPEVAETLTVSRVLRRIDPEKQGFTLIDSGGGAALWQITGCE